VYVGEQWSGRALGRNLRVLLAFVYAVSVCALVVLQLRPPSFGLTLGIAVGCWALMLALFVVRLARATDRWRALRAQVATALLLLTPVPFLAPIDNVYSVLLLLVAYGLVVRQLTAGDSMRFAALMVVGVVLLAAVGMSMAESADPAGSIDTFGQSLLWAAAEVLRLGALVEQDPVTHNGRVLGAVVIFSGVLLAAIVFAGITSWLVGEREHAEDADDEADLERRLDRLVRSALADALGPEAAAALGVAALPDEAGVPEVRVWVDTDRIAGSARGAWRRDRCDAVCDLLHAMDGRQPQDHPWVDLPLDAALPRPVAVLQGEAIRLCRTSEVPEAAAPRDPREPLTSSADGAVLVEREPATAGARSLIIERAVPGDVVVTSDPRLRDRLVEAGVTVVDVVAFRDLAPLPR
jgi:hypothetical protein